MSRRRSVQRPGRPSRSAIARDADPPRLARRPAADRRPRSPAPPGVPALAQGRRARSTPTWSSPSRSTPRSVPKSGTPRMKLWVPSIGSMYQRTAAPPASVAVLLADERRGPGSASAIRSRMSRSIAWSASVTNEPVGLALDHRGRAGSGAARSRRPRRTQASASVAASPRSSRSGRAAATSRARLHVGAASAARCRPLTTGSARPSGSHSGSRRDLEADPLAEDLDLAAGADRRPVRRQVGVGDRALDGEAVAAAGHPPDDRARRPGPARCRGRPSAGRRGRGSAAACAGPRPSPRRARRGR